jgi:hypothetical protein
MLQNAAPCRRGSFTVGARDSSDHLFSLMEISFLAFLAAEVKDFAGNSFLNSRCLWNIRLAIRILDKFF